MDNNIVQEFHSFSEWKKHYRSVALPNKYFSKFHESSIKNSRKLFQKSTPKKLWKAVSIVAETLHPHAVIKA